mgnify:CR=1 FL=1
MKTILCFGDSNTYGYQPETKKRYDETTRWTCLLQQAIQPYGWRVVEEGLCGRTTNLNGIRREKVILQVEPEVYLSLIHI